MALNLRSAFQRLLGSPRLMDATAEADLRRPSEIVDAVADPFATMVETLSDGSQLVEIQDAGQAAPPNPLIGGRLMWIGGNTAGVTITNDIAFQVSAVWACIDTVAAAIASSNWDVYGWEARDNKQQALHSDPLQYVLNVRFNKEMTAQSGKRALMIAALAAGNGWAEIVRNGARQPMELWPIDPRRCTLRRYEDSGDLFLRVVQDQGASWAGDGAWVDLDLADVFHIRGPGMSGLLGDNAIAKAVKSIALALAQEQFEEAYFGNGTHIGGVLTVKTKLDDTSYERMKAQMNEKRSGAKNAFKAMIAENGATWQAIDSNADKAQLIEARNQQIEEICRWWHVPPHKIAHLLHANLSNIEHQGLEFSRDTLRPWKIEIEQEGEYKLFPKRGQPRFICVDTAWASEGDFKSRADGYQVLRMSGIYSANDVLRKLGENTIGPAGDIRLVNGAAIRLEDVGKNYQVDRNNAPSLPEPDSPPAGGEAYVGWLGQIYDRVAKRFANRRQDLVDKGRNDAATMARRDAEAYLDEESSTIVELLNAWSGRDAAPWIKSLGADVIAGTDPKEAAAAAIVKLQAPQAQGE